MKASFFRPVRRGAIFCAPFCGRGCTHEEHIRAKRKAKELAGRLGKGWSVRVYENLGWHYNVVSPCGHMAVTESRHRGKNHYVAYFSDEQQGNGCSGIFAADGSSPRAAINAAVEQARNKWATISKMLMGFA